MNKFKIEVNGSTEIERLRSVFVSLQTCPLNKLLQMKWKASVSDIMLLIGALVLFTRRDAGILFNEKKDVDERAMVGCVYRYMFCARLLNVLESTQPDIDIEYDVDTSSGYFDKSIMVLVVGKNKPLFLKIRGYIGEHCISKRTSGR